MADKKLKQILHAAGAIQIDPMDCDSVISYKITEHRYLSACVSLTDCNRKISWYFENEQSAVDKIDAAIGVLQGFRADFVKARQSYKQRHAKTKKGTKTTGAGE